MRYWYRYWRSAMKTRQMGTIFQILQYSHSALKYLCLSVIARCTVLSTAHTDLSVQFKQQCLMRENEAEQHSSWLITPRVSLDWLRTCCCRFNWLLFLSTLFSRATLDMHNLLFSAFNDEWSNAVQRKIENRCYKLLWLSSLYINRPFLFFFNTWDVAYILCRK